MTKTKTTLPAEMFGGVIFGLKPGESSKFRPILDTQKTLPNFHGDEAKKKFFFWKKKIQNGRLKKLSFSKSPILKKFLRKFHGLVLGSIGLIDAKGIDVAQLIWP
jgi:hypothetical protein